MKKNRRNTAIKWGILILGGLTNTVVVAVQSMSLAVLLPEISVDLNLSLVQAGLIWGIGSLSTIFSSIFAGILADQLGPKRTIIIGCLSAGLLGASRGFSNNYTMLMVTIFLLGLCLPLITISNVKNTRIWFDEKEVGLANGVVSLGMALGFFIGSNVSATYISPWVGGWRNVFFFYGLIALLMLIPWLISPSAPASSTTPVKSAQKFSWKQFNHVIKIRDLWLIGLAFLAYNGGVQGLLGYLPLYLRNMGWHEISADSAASFFHLASMLCVIPMTYIADRLGTGKKMSIYAAALTTLGIGSLYFLNSGAIWVAVILAGLSRDGLMALLITLALKTKGVDTTYAGIATGFVIIFAGIGSMVSPPLGNRMADLTPSTPFLFWGVLCLVSVICIVLTRNGKTEKTSNTVETAGQ
ncbi:MAG: MFS transporter [Chloroflexota bacterium]|nr:MFS transporter [Chloroflexota bacterium]